MGHNNLYNCKLYFNPVSKQQIKVFYLNICSKRQFFACSLVFQSTEISLKSRSKENNWCSRCDQLSEVIQSKWKCWKPNYSIEEMIAWTSSFPWKCEPSCSPPQGTGAVTDLWNGTRTWSAIPGCKGSGRLAKERVYCSLQLWMQSFLHWVLQKHNTENPVPCKQKVLAQNSCKNLEHFDVVLVLGFWALSSAF